MHAAEHPRSDTGFTVSKTRMSLVSQRVRKRDLVWRCRCVSYVRTQVHMSSYLFVHICLHVTYTNNILDYERVTTEFTHASACSMCASMKQDGARQCLKRVHMHEARCSLVCEHKKHSDIIAQRRCFGLARPPSGTAAFSTPRNVTGLGVSETAVSVR